jgi:hypothetical protein
MSHETLARTFWNRVTEGLMTERWEVLTVALVLLLCMATPPVPLAAREPQPGGLGLTGTRGATS